ncbi:MAG: protein kinase [Actinomycetota bacterium]|nr:protein kinase [Actinomycetota bacterium]
MQCPNCGQTNRPDAAFCDSCGTRLAAAPRHQPAKELPQAGSGRYVALGFLGEGGRKQVFRATDTRLDREVALAIIQTKGLDDASIERVRREAKAMAKLGGHPNIVNIFDVGEEEGDIFLVSELMAGGSVDELLESSKGRGLPIDQVLRIADNVASALEYAHEQGILHRDIKPANVWLAKDGTPKLGDFGLAAGRKDVKLTSEGMMLGTVAYMSPEQATGKEVDVRSDLYSFGAMLYEAATGRPPFAGDDAVAIISQQINTAPVAPSWHNPDVPQPLEALILQLLAKSPDERPQSASEVRERLKTATQKTSAVTERVLQEERNPLERLASGVFVGREAETAELRRMFDEVRRSKGGIALLVGEPGIGKTRTSEELITYARLNGAQVLVGRCYEGEGAPAYWPWIQVIRSYVHERPREVLASEMGSAAQQIAQIVSDVKQLIPGIDTPTTTDPDAARFQLFDSVTTFLRNVARSRPLLIFLDDLHWADKSSLLMLEFLSRQIFDSQILILATYRDVELGRQHPLSLTLASIIREPNARRVLLRGLSESDVARYIKLSAGIEPAPQLVKAIFTETEGNPFFVSETVKLLVTEKQLEGDRPRSWSLTIPQGVKEVIGRRLDQLSEGCNDALAVASVIGREFDLAMIEMLSSRPAEELLEAMDEAVAARVVAPVTGTRYRFAHALIRETLYDELSTAKRLRLHRAAGQALEELSQGDPDRYLSELAYHFFEAAALGEVTKAIQYARRAGEKAMRLLAFEEAAAQFDRALQALEVNESGQEVARVELLLALGRAQTSAGEISAARKTFEKAADHARSLNLPEHFALAALGAGDVWTEAGFVNQDLVDLLEEAAAGIAHEESVLHVRVLARLGEAYKFDQATKHREIELSTKAVEMARRISDPGALAQAMYARVLSLGGPESIEEQLLMCTELIEAAERAGDIERKLLGLRLRYTCSFELGKLRAAQEDLRTYGKLAEKAKLPLYTWFTLISQSAWSLAEGRIGEADELVRRGIAEGRRAGDPNVDRFTSAPFLAIKFEQQDIGELDEALRYLDSESGIFSWTWGLLILYAFAKGDLDEARRLIKKVSSTGFNSFAREWGFVWMMGVLAEVCSVLDDAAIAEDAYDLVGPYDNHFAVPGYLATTNGSAHHHLGVLAATMKRFDLAESHLNEALRVHRAAGFVYLETRTRLAMAEMLAKRGMPGDDVRALKLLGEVVAAATAGSFKRTLQAAVDLRLSIQGLSQVDTSRSIHAIAAEVREERPELGSQAAPDGTVTILFTDIEGSTALNETLGDQRWIALLSVHDRIVRSEVQNAGGSVVKSRGDGFMLAFPSARQALRAAIAIQQALEAHNRESPESTPIRVRIGIHTGEVVRQSGDFFGRHVNFASRIADQAAGGEILVSELTKALLLGSPEFQFGGSRSASLKGFPGEHLMFSLSWSRAPQASP